MPKLFTYYIHMLLLICGFFYSTAVFSAQRYTVDGEQSFIRIATKMCQPDLLKGEFGSVSGEIILDEENLENSITLPKGVEISIGLYETKIESNQDKNEDPKLVYSPPIIVPLHSGTIFAVTVKEEENDDT